MRHTVDYIKKYKTERKEMVERYKEESKEMIQQRREEFKQLKEQNKGKLAKHMEKVENDENLLDKIRNWRNRN